MGATDFDCLLLPLLDDWTIQQDHRKQGQFWGNSGNLRACVNPYSVTLSGSLPEWFLSDNLQTINRQQTKQAIEKLSDSLSLPMARARVKRIDTAANLTMKFPLDVYFGRLGELSKFEKVPLPNGWRYSQHRRQLEFYDKIAEMKRKRKAIPGLFKDRYIMRFEYRYLYDLPHLLKLSEIRGETLYNDTFYQSLIQRWKEGYFSIEKATQNNNRPMPTENKFKTPNDLLMFLSYERLQEPGSEARAIQLIKDYQQKGDLSKMQAKRMRDTLSKIKEGAGIQNAGEDDILKEMDESINAAAVLNGSGGANRKGRK